MPGRTPNEAFSAFVEPLADALKCIAITKIIPGKGGINQVDIEHAISLTGNDNDGYVKLQSESGRPKLEFLARMRYMIIRDDRPNYGPYRITTRAYDYSIQTQDKLLVLAFHWHPTGSSHVTTPHVHIGQSQLTAGSVLSEKKHIVTGRVTFESVIATAIEAGAKPRYPDWQEILNMCEEPHLRFRTWTRDYELETGQKIS